MIFNVDYSTMKKMLKKRWSMYNNQITQWYEQIKAYIDGLNEQNKQTGIQAVLQVEIYKNSLAKARLPISISLNDEQFTKQQKELNKILKQAEKLKLTENSLSSAQSLYQQCIHKEWLDGSDDTLSTIELIQQQDLYQLWIRYALLFADGVTPATHIAKLTHSSSGGSAIIDAISDTKTGFLTTSQVDKPIYDGAYPNANLSKIAKFLLLSIDDVPLGVLLKQGNYTPLTKFFDVVQLKQVGDGFYHKLNPSLMADALIKQVYFPVDDSYHQLVILHSSSLIQEIYQRYFQKQVRDARIKIEKQQQENKYHQDILVQIPNTLTFSTVASQPQNVSVNHGSRGGNIRLFRASPPIWQSQPKAPIYYQSLFFDRTLNRMCKENIIGLQQMLITFDKANISFKEPHRLQGIINWLNAIIDDVFDYAQSLWNLPSGWSNHTENRLPIAHQLFLDSQRNDELFLAFKQSEWQKDLVQDFVFWLNNKLRDADKHFSVSEDHSRIWRKIFADRLREYVEQWI